jgi:glycosyltransferase involved in cell wall biosynthesis
MSMGKPIVYTPVGAHKEVLKNNIHGFQFPPGDLDTMKKAILQVLESPRKGEQIGRQNAQYAHSHFSISSISKCFKQILNQTLQS